MSNSLSKLVVVGLVGPARRARSQEPIRPRTAMASRMPSRTEWRRMKEGWDPKELTATLPH